MNKIVYAYYHSIYNRGKINIESICKVDLDKQEVFDIEGVELPQGIISLDEEYVVMLNGEKKEVVIHKEDMTDKSLLLGF